MRPLFCSNAPIKVGEVAMGRSVRHLYFICSLVLGGKLAVAQPGPDVPQPKFGFDEPRQTSNMPPLTVFDIAIGASEYPIFEMPMTESGDIRIDGSNETVDLKKNRGALLNIGIERLFPTKFANYSLGAGYHRASTVPGAGIPSPSAYVRIHADVAASLDLSTALYGLQLTPAIEARRSAYRNVESGHYVDGILIKSSISKTISDQWDGQLAGGYAPMTRVGLIQPSNNGKSGALADSSASMSEMSAKLSWSPDSTSNFNICAAQESVRVRFSSTNGYRAYGLPVAPLERSYSEKSYDLTTRYILIGTGRKF